MERFLAISMDWESGLLENPGSCMLDGVSGGPQVQSISSTQVAIMYFGASVHLYRHDPVPASFITCLSA